MPVDYVLIVLQAAVSASMVLVALYGGYRLLKPRMLKLISSQTRSLEARMMNAAPKIMAKMMENIDLGEIMDKLGGEDKSGPEQIMGLLSGGSKGGLEGLMQLLSSFSGQKQGKGGDSW